MNLAGIATGEWTKNYRCPDVAVFLRDTQAENCDTHWRGPADFLIEITSPGDRTHEKIPFYNEIGVHELLIVNRETWTLELYQRQNDQLQKTAESHLPDGADPSQPQSSSNISTASRRKAAGYRSCPRR